MTTGRSSKGWCGIFDAMEKLKSQDAKVSELMAAGYNIPASDAAFRCWVTPTARTGPRTSGFINQNNPTNFERIWQRAYMLYRRIGSISLTPVPFDQVMDFSEVIQKLAGRKIFIDEGGVNRRSLPKSCRP